MALRPGSNLPPAERNAQRKAAADDVLLREVDDAVRQDQYADFGKRYGKLIVGLVVLGLIAFGAYLYWQSRQEAAMERRSETLISALDQLEAGNLASASERLDPLIVEGGGASKTAAQMLQAGIALEQGREQNAAQLFAAVAADEDAAPALRDLATIREVAIRFDSMEPAQVIERLQPLAVPGNPWFGSAGELIAMAHLEAGDQQAAGLLLGEIAKADEVPESLRSRARQVAGLLGVDAIENVDALLQREGAVPATAPGAPSAQ